jgi:poly-gamma-glutamate synthesis protein (capsule biosynthesis protein)
MAIIKSYNDQKVLLSLLALAVVAGVAGGSFEWLKHTKNSGSALTASVVDSIPKEKDLPQVTLGFAGDIMLDRGVKTSVKKNFDGDYAKLFENAGALAEPDITFANLEGPVSTKGVDKKNLYSFRMDPAVLPVIKNAGIDVVSFANNHVGDWGRAAFDDSLVQIKEAGLLACGAGATKAEAARPAIIEDSGLRIGFLCFTDVGPNDLAATETKSGILLASDPDFEKIISSARSEVNTLVVSFHWGDEYKPVHNAHQEELAKKAIDSGASMIVGHHPHVAQDIGEYKDASILYSLGNFIFDQYFSPETMQGLYATATVTGNTLSDVKTFPTTISKEYSVTIEE